MRSTTLFRHRLSIFDAIKNDASRYRSFFLLKIEFSINAAFLMTGARRLSGPMQNDNYN